MKTDFREFTYEEIKEAAHYCLEGDGCTTDCPYYERCKKWGKHGKSMILSDVISVLDECDICFEMGLWDKVHEEIRKAREKK